MKALIAMSGGVDSSLAAKLTQDMGFDCIGCTMKLYDNEDVGLNRGHTCCSLDDVEDARSVARALGMPYYVFNFKEEFREAVIGRFVSSFEQGVTPNPCLDCNRYMKFEKLFERARVLSCEYIVTGHYARIEREGERYLLKKALDDTKDQSYVLYTMTQEQLSHTLFPLGSMRKSKVRELAEECGFVNARKADSQDICFVPDGDYAAFIRRYTGRSYPGGNFVDTAGNVLGQHKGIISYTIGQRKGLGIALGEPVYVKHIDPAANTVTLCRNEELFAASLRVEKLHWIAGQAPDREFRCTAKIRYRHREQPALLRLQPDGTALVTFDEPQRAATPGQAAVFYDGDTVLGGGTIRF